MGEITDSEHYYGRIYLFVDQYPDYSYVSTPQPDKPSILEKMVEKMSKFLEQEQPDVKIPEDFGKLSMEYARAHQKKITSLISQVPE